MPPTPCQRCSEPFDWTERDDCPNCGWSAAEWRDGGRFGLSTEGHGEPDDEGSAGGRTGGGSMAGVIR
jgi:hypothetical protein